MGESADCFKSSEEIAIERIARRRMEREHNGPSTDALDRATFEKYKQEVEDEFVLMNGRFPKRSIF